MPGGRHGTTGRPTTRCRPAAMWRPPSASPRPPIGPASPTLAYELGSAAERYAERGLLPPSRSWFFAIGRIGLRLWAGCHPSVATLLLVGPKPCFFRLLW